MGNSPCKHKKLKQVKKYSEYTTAAPNSVIHHVIRCMCTQCLQHFLIDRNMCSVSTDQDRFVDPNNCEHTYFVVDEESKECVIRTSFTSPLGLLVNLGPERCNVIATAICQRCLSEISVHAVPLENVENEDIVMVWKVPKSALPRKVKPDMTLGTRVIV